MSLFNTTTTTPTTNGTPAPAKSGSLFGSVQKPPAAAPTPAPQATVDRAAVDAAKARYAAEDATDFGFCNKCGTKLAASNTSTLKSGVVVHVGCTVVAPGQIVPSDAARPTLAQSAVPVPAGELAQVTDPEILRRAAEVQAAHDAEKATKATEKTTAATTEKKGGRCSAGGTEHALSQKEIVTRKTKCPGCGKDIAIKDEHFNATFNGMKIPSHNMLKVETVAAPPQRAPEAQQAQQSATQTAPAVAVQPSSQTTQPAPTTLFRGELVMTPTEKWERGIEILVDALRERGPRPTPLEDYWRPMVTELEKQAGGCDLRCAAKDTPVAYGAWKGYLTTWVRESPPAPGVYFARGGNDFDMVVVDALAQIADVTRGVR